MATENKQEKKTNEKETEIKENKGTKRVPFAVVEAYKTARTNLTFLLSAASSNIITISSAEVSDGKSTTSVNVAIAFSQLGQKVLLIDGDLRRCSLHKKLKIDNEKGLSTVLAGIDKFEDAIKSTSDTLDVLTAGQIPPNPSELLESEAFKNLLEEKAKEYAYIIIDTPPITVVSDALIVGGITKGIILVVREGYTTTDSVDKALSAAQFAGIDVLGVIMNGVNGREKRYKYYRYRYRYYGRSKNYNSYYKYGDGYGYGAYSNAYSSAYARAAEKAQKAKEESAKSDKAK